MLRKTLILFLAFVIVLCGLTIVSAENHVLKQKVGDTTVTVEGNIPDGVTLEVKKAKETARMKKVFKKDNIALRDTYDIKLKNEKGKEVQPENDVQISFKNERIKDLDVNVYHFGHKPKKLDVKEKSDTAVCTTDGFSYYTVEFYYNDKEYVMEGGSYVKLNDILDSVGLKGEVSSWDVSDKDLFDIVKGDEDGVKFVEKYKNDELTEYYPVNKKDGDILYLVSLEPFTSEEWLKIVIDGIEYKIKVTDAIRVDDDGNQIDSNVKYMNSSGASVAITDDRVIQGPIEHDFAASMPIAEIFIDDSVVNMSLWKNDSLNGSGVIAELLVNDTQDNGKYKGFTLNTNTSSLSPGSPAGLMQSYGGLYYDFSKRYLNNTQNLTVSGTNINNYELFPGDIIRYTIKGKAIKYDNVTRQYKNYDIVITYSDVLITLCNNSGTAAVNQSQVASDSGKLTLFDTNLVYPFFTGSSPIHRAGITYKTNVKIVDPDTKETIPGSYNFPMVDIDISRNTISGMANLYNASDNMRYSEQVALLSNYGRPTVSGLWEQKVWIPGGSWSESPTTLSGVTKDNHPYVCLIDSQTVDSQSNTLIFKPGTLTTSPVTSVINNNTEPDQGLDNSFYSGFLTLANNTAGGINIKGWGSATPGGGMESYVLTGSRPVNYKLAASSGVGGTIYTTNMGNHQGDLSVGDKVGTSDTYSPYLISTTYGQAVTYTMTPKAGYRIKKVYVKKGDIDVMEDFQNGNANETTNLRAIGNDVYAYDFTEINSDNSIHVEWEPTKLKVKKTLANSNQNEDFTFRLKVWGSTHSDYDIKSALEAQGCTQISSDTYEFTIRGNEEKTFSGIIPFEWNYEITEQNKDNWTLVSSSENASVNGFDGNETVNFINKRNDVKLTVSKNVKGKLGDKTKKFAFELTSDRNLAVPGISPTSQTEERYRGSCSIRAEGGVYKMTSLVNGYPGYIQLSKEGATTYNNIDSTWELEQTIFNNVSEATISDGKIVFNLMDGKVFKFGFPNLSEGASATANNFRELVTTYTYRFNLADDEELVVPNVPFGTNVSVKEKASNHVASVTVINPDTLINTANTGKEEALTTGNVSIINDTDFKFVNTRELETVTSAGDDVTWILILLIIVTGISLMITINSIYSKKHNVTLSQ